MTTPNVEIAMPYGYTVGGAPDMYWLTRADGSTANVDLVPGPCRVMASWAGPERASFVLLHANGGKSVLDTIEKKAGGVTQFSDGYRRRCQGRPGTSRSFSPHHDRRDRHHRGVPGGIHRVAQAVV